MIVAVRQDILSLFDLFRVNTKTTSEMTEKLACRETRGPVLTSIFPSLPISLARFCTPPEIANAGKKNRYRKFFFAVLIGTLCRFYEANKKNQSYTL